jgi:hypothetical protein
MRFDSTSPVAAVDDGRLPAYPSGAVQSVRQVQDMGGRRVSLQSQFDGDQHGLFELAI